MKAAFAMAKGLSSADSTSTYTDEEASDAACFVASAFHYIHPYRSEDDSAWRVFKSEVSASLATSIQSKNVQALLRYSDVLPSLEPTARKDALTQCIAKTDKGIFR